MEESEDYCKECEHAWAEHDIYGCWRFECSCTMIHPKARFDKATRRVIDL